MNAPETRRPNPPGFFNDPPSILAPASRVRLQAKWRTTEQGSRRRSSGLLAGTGRLRGRGSNDPDTKYGNVKPLRFVRDMAGPESCFGLGSDERGEEGRWRALASCRRAVRANVAGI